MLSCAPTTSVSENPKLSLSNSRERITLDIISVLGWLALFALPVGFVLLWYLVPQLCRWRQVRRWRGMANVMALTYDDGPDSETTMALLELLDELKAKATFYLVGFRAEREPDALAALAQSGHELGTHSYSHLHAWKISPWLDQQDAQRGYRVLMAAVGPQAPYRPPFGKVSLNNFLSMLKRGRRVDWWTRPTNDTDDTFEDPLRLANRILDDKEPVILMHSHHAEPHRREFMLQITRALVLEARDRGVSLVTMSELDKLSKDD